jgi:glyoxylate/hydroxypyruvate reductase A
VKPRALFLLQAGWNELGADRFASPVYEALFAGRDSYAPESIDYFVGFRPEPGFLKTLPRLKAIISLGAGVDGFLRDPDFPRHVPLVRSVDPNLAIQMSEYVTLQVLTIHRHQRFFDAAQRDHAWRQRMLTRNAGDIRIGILGLGTIGNLIASRLRTFDFQVSGWSRSRKDVPGVKSFAGESELPAFLSQCDMLVCVLPLTHETRGILNAKLFAQLPEQAWVINVARGAHLIEDDLIAALDRGHLAGAVLDVFQTEPLPSDSPIWAHPRITATPHIAGITEPRTALAYVEDCIARAEAGKPLPNVVDITRGY